MSAFVRKRALKLPVTVVHQESSTRLGNLRQSSTQIRSFLQFLLLTRSQHKRLPGPAFGYLSKETSSSVSINLKLCSNLGIMMLPMGDLAQCML